MSIFLMRLFLISLFEEAFFTIYTLALMGRFDLLVPNRRNILTLSVPILGSALFCNLLIWAELNQAIVYFSSVLLLYGLLAFIVKGEYLKLVYKLGITLLIFIAIESSYMPLWARGLGIAMENLHSNISMALLITLPERIAEFVLIARKIRGKNDKHSKIEALQVSVYNILKTKKPVRWIYTFLFLLNFTAYGLLCKAIGFDHILSQYDIIFQLVITIFFVIYPFLNIACLDFVIYNMARDYKKHEYYDIGNINSLSEEILSAADNKDLESVVDLAEKLRKATDLI